MCLDESIVSAASAEDAIVWGAAAIINIKPSRVGGYLEARRIHDVALAHGTPVWCGGMLETGIGRAANAALAGMPGFTITGDISASGRFYRQDITDPFELVDGHILIPDVPGLGRAAASAAAGRGDHRDGPHRLPVSARRRAARRTRVRAGRMAALWLLTLQRRTATSWTTSPGAD